VLVGGSPRSCPTKRPPRPPLTPTYWGASSLAHPEAPDAQRILALRKRLGFSLAHRSALTSLAVYGERGCSEALCGLYGAQYEAGLPVGE